jgi:sigma-B regulation protein RsbU (phosphoserine phosphatase)
MAQALLKRPWQMGTDPERQLKAAAMVQQSLLPRSRHAGPFYTTAGASDPCWAVGGDFFDYVDLRTGHFGFILGDVSGKGPGAALVAAAVLGMFSTEARYHAGPAALLKRLNDTLLARAIEVRFVSTFYAILERDGALTYANGGHHAPVLQTAQGTRRLDAGGVALGLFGHASFEEETVVLEPGDLVAAFSDGIVDATNERGEEFGEPRLLAVIERSHSEPPDAVVRAVFDEVMAFSEGTTRHDDMAMVVMRYEGPDA